MVISDEPLWGDAVEDFVQEYDDVIVYGDREGETVLHEGGGRILANGWVMLPTDRLLSPDAVHDIDTGPR
ncbi:Uncharacterized protein HSRCO_1873 [Halanaeroarchaeum sp. HSR-CO]|uniref:hypothetical protein n=1 Tax=Halanaeroarchaeum sp. HSR-CO TaxID=2866382 RepID=UPI00217D60BE|nr:hypothetical protein [Halanaeroarchaeum sp. HSR-CO]UWG48151.1 Uncharacterized protein HSRCO_1873 [Halanaeroarchaeum sp. HSR-CO]